MRWESFRAAGYLAEVRMKELSMVLKRTSLRVVSWSCPCDLETIGLVAEAADRLRALARCAGTVFLCADTPKGDGWPRDWLQEAAKTGETWSVTVCPRLPRRGDWSLVEATLQDLEALHSHTLGLCFEPARLMGCGVSDLGQAWSRMARHVRLCRAEPCSEEGEDVNYPVLKELLSQAPDCDGIVVEEVAEGEAGRAFLDGLFRLWPQGEDDRPEPKVSLFPPSYIRSPRPRRKKRRL